MTKQENHFIKFYNVFSEPKSKYHLSIEELYLYGLLKTMSNIENTTITTVNIINEITPIDFLAVEKKARNRVKHILLSLRQKEIITFKNKQIGTNQTLQIGFIENLSDESIGKKGIKGFESVPFSLFRSVESMEELYIYFTVKRFDKLGGFVCSFDRWKAILKVTERKANILIKCSS